MGEFSRTILGSHFKHNNVRFSRPALLFWAEAYFSCPRAQFSSFVRQLNMYGFHKINRVREPPYGFCALAITLVILTDTPRSAHLGGRPDMGVLPSQIPARPP